MSKPKPGRESAYHPRCAACDAPMRVNRNDRRRGPDLVCQPCRMARAGVVRDDGRPVMMLKGDRCPT